MPPSLTELIAGVLDVSAAELTLDSGPKNLPKWDSLAHVTIASAVEQTYSVTLTMPEILAIKSIADLERILKSRGIAAD